MKAIKHGFLVLSLALAGCASGFSGGTPLSGGVPTEEIYRKGETSPSTFLSTVIVRPEGCAPHGTACTVAGPHGVVVVVPFREETPSWMYEMFAHEICHVVAAVKEVQPDPCHREDGGQIRADRGRRMGAAERARSLARSTQEGSSSGQIRLTDVVPTIRVP